MNYIDSTVLKILNDGGFVGVNTHNDYQFEVFKYMLEKDYVVFRAGRSLGKTFLLALFYCYMKRWFPEKKVGVCSSTSTYPRLVLAEIKKLGYACDTKPLDKFEFNDYDMIVVDEAQSLSSEYIDILYTAVESKTHDKLIFCCNGYKTTNNFLKLEHLISQEPNSKILVKGYDSAPVNWFDPELMQEAKQIMTKEDFDMEYLAKIVN